jgi:hypothetical protein
MGVGQRAEREEISRSHRRQIQKKEENLKGLLKSRDLVKKAKKVH